MLGTRVENAPKLTTKRMHDISAWQEEDISLLSNRRRKRYKQHKAALEAYFTTNKPLRIIVHQYYLQSEEALLEMASKCLMQHEDGMLWGFRALLPGVTVIDYAVHDEGIDTTKREVVKISQLPQTLAMPVPETPLPAMPITESMEAQPAQAQDEPAVEQPEAGVQEPMLIEPMAAADAHVETAALVDEAISAQDAAAEESLLTTPVEDSTSQTAQHPVEAAKADNMSTRVKKPIVATERVLEKQTDNAALAPTSGSVRLKGSTAEKQRATSAATTGAVALAAQPRANVMSPHTRETTTVARLVVRGHAHKRPVVTPKRTTPRLIRKRWQRDGHGQIKAKQSLKVISIAVVAAIILFALIPVGAGLAAYNAYNNVNATAHEGIDHLLKVKSLLNVSKSDPLAALNATKLQQAQLEFRAAESDFDQLQQLADRPDIQSAIVQFAPQYASKLNEVQSLVQVALDVSRMGNELTGVGMLGANIIHGSPLATTSNKPLITASDVTAIDGAMTHALYYIDDIRMQLSHISIKDLPISTAQKAQLTSILPLLPQVQGMITQAQGLTGAVTWLLGIGQPRRFLIQTMDSGELRPGGGFTGQYGILQIQNGRVTPPSLTDVTMLDYAGNGTAIGRSAPAGYSWMNFGNWGIRDSNLSSDFPTTARMTMQLFQDEGGGPIDGDIAFTPALIAHILDVVGPINVPGYNETITSQNLEEKLHYYQQDFSAIAKEKQISGNYSHTGRKAFTSTLSKILLDRVRHLQPKQLMEIAKGALKDLQSRDLEIYFTNPIAEGWLVAHGYSGSIDTFSTADGFIVSQANVSISKASQYVHTTEHDDITLDAQGGALHQLTIMLDYNQTGPVYGNDTYADYIRIYAPKTAQFVDGSGFDSGQPLCSSKAPPGTTTTTPTTSVTYGCSSYYSSFGDARYCPNGNYSLGYNGMLAKPWTIDSLGPPTAQISDLPGRSMWGGMTETPKNCISTITVSWYVPQAVKTVHGKPVYTLLVQKQAGMVPTIELNIDASAIKGLKSLTFSGDILADKTFVLTVPTTKK